MGSCMACSHDQQWEKRWNMLGSSTEGWPLRFSTCEASSQAGLSASSSCLFFLMGASHPEVPHPRAQHCCLRLVCTSQVWGQISAPWELSHGHGCPSQTLSWLLSCRSTSQSLTCLSCCVAPAHNPFAQQLLKSNLDLNYLLLTASLILVGRRRPVAAGTWSAVGLPTRPGRTTWHWAASCLHHRLK